MSSPGLTSDPTTTSGSRSLRAVALIALVVGALGSVALLFHASQSRPPLLMVLFLVWVLFPFVGLIAIDRQVSKRGSSRARLACYWLMILLSLVSLAIYGNDAVNPRKAQAAFVFVMVPLASWLLLAVFVPVVVLLSHKRSRPR